jgi:hypothetical protein
VLLEILAEFGVLLELPLVTLDAPTELDAGFILPLPPSSPSETQLVQKHTIIHNTVYFFIVNP